MAKLRTGITAKFHAAIFILGVGVLSAIVLWGSGCSRSDYGQFSPNAENLFWAGVRPASGDSTRLLRNAHYLKLLGRPELALRELEAAYHQDPQNLRVLDTLARAYEEMGEFNRALKIYREALALDPSNQAVSNNLCFSYYLAGQWDQAEACFRQALDKNPQNIAARNNLGLLLCRRGRQEEARRLWQEAEGDIAAQKKMGQVMVALGPGEPVPYAQHPQPAPAPTQIASAPAAETVPPARSAAKDTVPPRITAPPTQAPQAQVPASTAPQARDNGKVVAAAAPHDKLPAPAVTAAKPAPPPTKEPAVAAKPKTEAASPGPVAKPTPAATPVKTAPKVVAAAPPDKLPAPALTAKKVAPPPTKEPAVAAKPKAEAASPRPVAKPTPAATPVKAAPKVMAAAPPVTQPPPAPPKQTADTEKKPLPAITPPPSTPQLKTKVAAAPVPAPVPQEKPAKFGIELQNGSGAKSLARKTRTMLKEEGFKVVSIGNYRDFGAENTVIYYQPEAEKEARALSAKFFPRSRLETGGKYAKNAAIKVLLGKDMLRASAPAGDPALGAEKIAAGPHPSQAELKPTAPPAAPTQVAALVKTPTPPPSPSPAAAAPKPGERKSVSRPHLTAAELADAAIEIRNGSGAQNLAHQARSMISQEGFLVGLIGNHWDFGAEKTIIYYRPEAEKVARSLKTKFFPHSQMEQSAKLSEDMAIKVLLGKDLLQFPEVMAKLSD